MTRFLLAGLAALTTAACGVAPMPAPLTRLPVTTAGHGQLSGAYLSLEVQPHDQLLGTARSLRRELGFLDLSQALPPRPAEDYHVTVAYFRVLSREAANVLARKYKGRQVDLEVTGWGVAQDRAAYFAVQGLDGLRREIRSLPVNPFTADDAHITFGVSPVTRKDVHGVPKPARHALPPIALVGRLHLKQGSYTLW